MLREAIFSLLIGFFALHCSAKGVLKEHIRERFLKHHNLQRVVYDREPLEWNERLAANAMQNARELGSVCWANDWAAPGVNVYQQWGARIYQPRQVVREWMYEDDTKENVLYKPYRFMGCGYVSCQDKWSYATAVIYVCHFSIRNIK